jgi:hypothetical protein
MARSRRSRRPAETEREWWALLKSKDKHFIRSMKDWRAALADPRRNPLKGCDSKTIKHFTKSLKFKHGGLAHADYSQVARQVSYSQFEGLWGRFGLGLGLFADHKGYRCESKGTCVQSEATICTSNC